MNRNTDIREIIFFLFMSSFINCTPVCLAVNIRGAISQELSPGNSDPASQLPHNMQLEMCKHVSWNPRRASYCHWKTDTKILFKHIKWICKSTAWWNFNFKQKTTYFAFNKLERFYFAICLSRGVIWDRTHTCQGSVPSIKHSIPD